MKKIYKLYGCQEKCELFEYPGPHAYSDASVKKINAWFDKYVAQEKHPEIKLGDNFIPESELAIFNGKSPQPDRLNLLPELLTVQKTRSLPEGQKDWEKIRREALQDLKKNVFHWLDRCNEKLVIKNTRNWILEGKAFRRYKGEVSGMECYFEAFSREKSQKLLLLPLATTDTTRTP